VKTLALDVTDKSAVDMAVRQANDHFGRIDVVVNNAGFGLFGAIEEVTEAQARAQIETNLFGALWVSKAVLPYMRAQGFGHIIQVSSAGGVAAYPTFGLYHASKWALEGFSQALQGEVAQLGLKVTIVEPGGYATQWGRSSAVHSEPIQAYDPIRNAMTSAMGSMVLGDPIATAPAIMKVVDAAEPPLRIFLGAGNLEMIRAEYAGRIAVWEQWDPVAIEAQGKTAL
jgi:NAD(P)-dependent dehydrogenase (short-subunit alcohol dehydrogenase family)